MSRTVRLLMVLTLAVLLTAGVGCRRSSRSRTQASGTVTVDGQPVKLGRITFTPAGIGTPQTAAISNGKYTLRGRRSMMAGEYTVRIVRMTGDNRGGYDREWTEKVVVGGGFTRPKHDFHLK